jgi:ATP adenylyltransferase/5',5'''-P-1,P-4-tetraphosphate phosphorylase II
MGSNWMLIVLRKKEKAFDLASLNTLGVLGSVFTKTQKIKDFFLKKKPSDIFNEILVKEDDLNEYKMEM